MPTVADASLQLCRTVGGWCGRFTAMASPCEVLIEGGDAHQARGLLEVAAAEALRIEHKFSRYRNDSVVAALHAAQGRPVELDIESADLIDFAAHGHLLSDGLFDITSGVLRAAWRFDSSGNLPDPAWVHELQQRIGFGRLVWQRPWLTVPVGMEIDLGGIGKEYAVDRVLGLLRVQTSLPLLVNLGGDLAVSGPRAAGQPWQVGIERPEAPGAAGMIEISAGALATSGDARRHLLHDGVRYGHILKPRTGWPVRDAPRAVTVAAGNCTQAGFLATLALLQGSAAAEWLQALEHPHWVSN